MTEPGGKPAGVPRELRAWIDEGDTVRWAMRPSVWAVAIESWRSVMLATLGASLVAVALAAWRASGDAWATVAWTLVVVVWARLVFQSVVVASRRYVMTDRYVLRVGGVLRRGAISLPIDRVQHVVLVRSLAQRLTGTGTIGFATAGTGGIEVVWLTVSRPLEWLAQARDAIERPPKHTEGAPTMPQTPATPPRPVVIGLAGGIGAGKSAVAAALAERGCVVADSDRASREALARPEVRETLVAWWGEEILDDEGQIDRKQVAQVVFERPDQRERLEGLIHPLVLQARAETVRQAQQDRALGVVIDAPLLFEAGLDAECDAIMFVDTPLETREARVRETRGWDEGELERREKVQLPLDAKRNRSDYVVVNDADPDALRTGVWRILDIILETHRGQESGPNRSEDRLT